MHIRSGGRWVRSRRRVPAGDNGAVHEVAIATDTIRLGQLLKLANLVDSGSDAKILLSGGEVSVNGAVETRRGRQVRPGDVVRLDDVEVRVVAG